MTGIVTEEFGGAAADVVYEESSPGQNAIVMNCNWQKALRGHVTSGNCRRLYNQETYLTMKIKTFIATGAMLASFVVLGSAKSWDIVIDSNTKAGSVTLPAGNYSVKVDNNQALFTSDSGKKFTVPVKIDTGAAKKYDETQVKAAKQGDTYVIQAIDLGGTTQELQFGE
jgi:hypothetical protein